MTRACMDCRAVIGEKCPKCGAEASELTNDIFICIDAMVDGWRTGDTHHPAEFKRGEGGVSHGICQPCFDKRRAAADARATANL